MSVEFETAPPVLSGETASAKVTTFEYIENDEQRSLTGYRVLLEKVDERWKVEQLGPAKKRRSTSSRDW